MALDFASLEAFLKSAPGAYVSVSFSVPKDQEVVPSTPPSLATNSPFGAPPKK